MALLPIFCVARFSRTRFGLGARLPWTASGAGPRRASPLPLNLD